MANFRRTKEVKDPVKRDHSTAKRTALVLLVLLLFGGTFTWAMMHREDPQLTKVKEIRSRLEAEGLSRDQRREIFGEMREEAEKLTPQQRESLWADRMKEREEREKKEMREFFALTKEQQIAALDKEIERMNDRSQRGRGRGGPGGPGNGGWGQGGSGGGGGRDGGGGSRRQSFGRDSNTGQASATNRAKGYLDRTDPDTRAQKTEYRRMLTDRRNQRG